MPPASHFATCPRGLEALLETELTAAGAQVVRQVPAGVLFMADAAAEMRANLTSRIATPQDFHDRLLSYKGAAFGLEPVLLQSAWFRPHNRSEDVKHLYLVGAGTHPGAGVPGVLMSAKALDSVVPDAHRIARVHA